MNPELHVATWRLAYALQFARRQQARLHGAFEEAQARDERLEDEGAVADDDASWDVGDHGELLIGVAHKVFLWRRRCVAVGLPLPEMKVETITRHLRNLIEHRDEWVRNEFDYGLHQDWLNSPSGRRYSEYGEMSPLGSSAALDEGDGFRLTHIGAFPLEELAADLDRLEVALDGYFDELEAETMRRAHDHARTTGSGPPNPFDPRGRPELLGRKWPPL